VEFTIKRQTYGLPMDEDWGTAPRSEANKARLREWDCPPENCGGIPGYSNMLDPLADPEHPDHADVAEYLED
jgi:hypothetical protein